MDGWWGWADEDGWKEGDGWKGGDGQRMDGGMGTDGGMEIDGGMELDEGMGGSGACVQGWARVRPAVQVSGKESHGLLILSCRAHGFYPRSIAINWLRKGRIQAQETKRGSTAPNSDGTYHAWASIEALAVEKDEYQCRVEHASLPEPGLFSWGEHRCLELAEHQLGDSSVPLLTAPLSSRAAEQPAAHRHRGCRRCARRHCGDRRLCGLEEQIG
uniref:Ig-like domain-containing protein n=1 Tax=Apteryx owenii TaxID=8824 RepID=A0A8B9PRE5_APTOW